MSAEKNENEEYDWVFEAGDIVQLKSGGPKMTVHLLSSSGEGCRCKWFSGSKVQESYFCYDSLVLVEEESKRDG